MDLKKNQNKPQNQRIVIEADRSGESATPCLYAYYLVIDFWKDSHYQLQWSFI